MRWLLLLVLLCWLTPVDAQTPVSDLQPLMPENAADMETVAVLGNGFVSKIAWSPDGRLLALAGMRGIWVFNAEDLAEPPRLFEGHNGEVTSLAFSADSTQLATGGSDRTVRLWSIADGTNKIVMSKFSEWANGASSVAFQPNGHLLAAGDEGQIRLFDLELGREIEPLVELCLFFSHHIAFSHDGDLLACASDTFSDGRAGDIGIWRFSTDSRVEIERDYRPPATSISFSHDDQLVVETDTYQATPVYLWDRESLQEQTNWWEQIDDPLLSPSAPLVATTAYDNQIILRDTETGEPVTRFVATADVTAKTWSPNGEKMAYIAGQRVYIWHIEAQRVEQIPFAFSASTLTAIAFSPDGGTIAAAGVTNFRNYPLIFEFGENPERASVQLWDVGSRTIRQTLQLPRQQAGINVLAFNRAGTELAAIGGGYFYLWDTTSGTLLEQQRFDDHTFYDLAFDGRQWVILACVDSEAAGTPEPQSVSLEFVFISDCHDRSTARLSGDQSVIVANRFNDNGAVLERLSVEPQPFEPAILLPLTYATSIAFSPSSDLVAWGTGEPALGGTVNVAVQMGTFDTETQTLLAFEQAYDFGAVGSITFSPDGSLLAAGFGDYRDITDGIMIWDVETQSRLITITDHAAWVKAVAFHPQGLLLASASNDGTIRLWGVRKQ